MKPALEMMPSERLYVTVPSQLMKGTVQVKDPSSMSPLHVLTLQAVSRHGDLKSVLDAFGVGRRVMQSVLADLFYEGLIYLNLQEGQVVLAPTVKQAMEQDCLEELLEMHAPKEIEVTWVQEMVSGGIMVYPFVSKYLSRPSAPGGTVSLTPKPSRVVLLRDLPVRTLAKAAFRVIGERVPGGGSVVDRVERITDRQAVGSRLFYVPVRVVRPTSDQPPLFLPEVEGVPRAIVDAWTAVLNPNRESFDLLDQTRLARDPLRAISPDGLADEWEILMKSVKRLVDDSERQEVDSARFANMSDDLLDLGSRLIDAKYGAHESHAVAGPVDVHLSAMRELMAAANRVVVIGSAFLRLEALRSIAPAVQEAVERGVNVVLLWGLADMEERGSEGSTFLEANAFLTHLAGNSGIASEGGAWLVPAASPFHSKFVAVDGHTAMVSSVNWLSSRSGGGVWEASIVVRGGRIPTEILSYAVERIPADHPSRRVAEDVLAETQAAVALDVDRDEQNRLVSELSAVLEDASETGVGGFRSTIDSLLRRAEPMISEIRGGRSAVIVRDAEHRRLMTSALTGAKDRLVVTSDRIREEGAGRVFGRLAMEATRRGVTLKVRWGREVPEEEIDEDAQRSALRATAIKAELGPACNINMNPGGTHAKLVLMDKSLALVSSFNFLSFGGTAGSERTLAGELGVAVFDAQVVEALSKSMDEHDATTGVT